MQVTFVKDSPLVDCVRYKAGDIAEVRNCLVLALLNDGTISPNGINFDLIRPPKVASTADDRLPHVIAKFLKPILVGAMNYAAGDSGVILLETAQRLVREGFVSPEGIPDFGRIDPIKPPPTPPNSGPTMRIKVLVSHMNLPVPGKNEWICPLAGDVVTTTADAAIGQIKQKAAVEITAGSDTSAPVKALAKAAAK